MVSFEELGICKRLAEACDKKFNWKTPNEIHIKTIPRIIEGNHDLVVYSRSGKTGVFLPPLINSLLHQPQAYLACVVVPDGVSAALIFDKFEQFKDLGVTPVRLFSGYNLFEEQQLQLLDGPHILVATPFRLNEHLKKTKGYWPRLLKYLILDESDLLLAKANKVVMDEIFNTITRERTYLFSSREIPPEGIQRACLNPVVIKAAY